MPELPEVECVRRSLTPLLGTCLGAPRIRRAGVIDGPREHAALLAGDTLASLERRGKQLALVGASGRVLVVQLGMTGQLLLADQRAEDDLNHVHVAWPIQGHAGPNARLLFRDPRRFGGLTPLPSVHALLDRWAALGPDALTIRPSDLAAGLAGSRRAIKAALLDQSVLAGVGNIYADEALFAARISPRRSSHRLSPHEVEALADAIRATLAAAVDAGGSTLRDYLDARGQPGRYADRHSVYGRGGLPCRACGHALRSTLIAQRTTVWCPRCQRRVSTALCTRPPQSKVVSRWGRESCVHPC